MNIRTLSLPLIALALIGCSGGDTMSSTGGDAKSGGGTTGTSSGGSSEAVTLRLKPKEGAIYVLENSSDQGGASSKMTMSTKIVKSNDSDVIMESSFSGEGPDAATLKDMKVTVTSNPRYEIKGVKVDSTDPKVAMMGKGMESAMKMMPVFPENAIKPGDTWKGSFDLGKMMTEMGLPATFKGDTVMDLTFTFKGVEDRNGRKCAIVTQEANDKLTMSMNGQDQEMTMKLSGESAFDLESGMAISTSTSTDTGFGGTVQTSKQTVNLKEIK